jgi:glutamine amidotransferase
MSFNRSINPKISFKGFQQRGKNNPDGWGIAYYQNQKVLIKKEPINALSSDFLKSEKNLKNIRSKIVIGHVRKMSQGKLSYNNTHPFLKELNGGKYTFAHNGTIHLYKNFKLKYFFPCGETDSEYIFCYLLDCIQEKGIKNWNKNDFKWLEQKFRKINESGTLNCFMSNGEYLFCYHDTGGYNSLYFVQRKPPYREIKLKDIDWEVDLKEEKNPNKTGFIIATKPLTDENWREFKRGELIVFKNGLIKHKSFKFMSM